MEEDLSYAILILCRMVRMVSFPTTLSRDYSVIWSFQHGIYNEIQQSAIPISHPFNELEIWIYWSEFPSHFLLILCNVQFHLNFPQSKQIFIEIQFEFNLLSSVQ